ncbi:hypothetical protein M569_07714, partial [Genlisea aurea]
GSAMSREMHSHLSDLIVKGNKAFRQHRFEHAIEFYKIADKVKPGVPLILRNRCAAYLRQVVVVHYRPASASEYRPLIGLDPTTLAALALKDAEKILSLDGDSVTSYILKADALILMEKYEEAKNVIVSGLQLQPHNVSLLKLEKSVATPFIMRRSRNVKSQRTDDYDCTLCLKLLYEPITTPCGHSFCRSCLFQSMDRANKCPLCRTVLFISPRTCAISVTLNNIIQQNFPEEYAERKKEDDSLNHPGADILPLFVMDAILPCQKFQLNIFEPRYRLMVVIDPATGSIADHACEVEITDCEPLPDGRFFLEIEGRRRCRIIRSWDQDGYRVAEVEWVEDITPTRRDKLVDIANKAATFALKWIKTAQESANQDRATIEELYNVEGMMPTTEDPERFSFWLASLSNLTTSERLELLRMTSTEERITRGLLYMR